MLGLVGPEGFCIGSLLLTRVVQRSTRVLRTPAVQVKHASILLEEELVRKEEPVQVLDRPYPKLPPLTCPFPRRGERLYPASLSCGAELPGPDRWRHGREWTRVHRCRHTVLRMLSLTSAIRNQRMHAISMWTGTGLHRHHRGAEHFFGTHMCW